MESIESVRDRFEASLMRLPNVIGVGIGRRGGEPVIEVLVSKKLPGAGGEAVPESLGGYPVAVVEAGDVTAHDEHEGSHGT